MNLLPGWQFYPLNLKGVSLPSPWKWEFRGRKRKPETGDDVHFERKERNK
jgi:hypothetical protein